MKRTKRKTYPTPWVTVAQQRTGDLRLSTQRHSNQVFAYACALYRKTEHREIAPGCYEFRERVVAGVPVYAHKNLSIQRALDVWRALESEVWAAFPDEAFDKTARRSRVSP